MTATSAPVLKHKNWRFLLREFTRAHPALAGLSSAQLERRLTLPASVAWWLATFAPELLRRPALRVVLPGAGALECDDAGRWMSFIPWLAGVSIDIDVTLVGLQLSIDNEGTPRDSSKISRVALEREWVTPAGQLVASRKPAEIFNGSLGGWRQCTHILPDVCLLFAPGFESHGESWVREEELVGLLRAGVPTGILPYSEVDGLVDMHLLRACGLLAAPVEMQRNPWHLDNPDIDRTGALALMGWRFEPQLSGEVCWSKQALDELHDLQDGLRNDFMSGGDALLRWIGTAGDLEEGEGISRSYLLPNGYLVHATTGEVFTLDAHMTCQPTEPAIFVPLAALANPVTESLDVVARWKWSLGVYREHVEPFLADDADEEAAMNVLQRLLGELV